MYWATVTSESLAFSWRSWWWSRLGSRSWQVRSQVRASVGQVRGRRPRLLQYSSPPWTRTCDTGTAWLQISVRMMLRTDVESNVSKTDVGVPWFVDRTLYVWWIVVVVGGGGISMLGNTHIKCSRPYIYANTRIRVRHTGSTRNSFPVRTDSHQEGKLFVSINTSFFHCITTFHTAKDCRIDLTVGDE